jgi:hypothetical protein
MLPSTLPGARVLAFSYPKFNLDSKHGDQADYLHKAADDLLRSLDSVRRSEDHRKVPIVFIGAGFGGIVVQKAVGMASAKERSNTEDIQQTTTSEKNAEEGPPLLDLDRVAEVIFLDTPFPEELGGDLAGFFPPNVNLRMCGILDIVGKMEKVWKGTIESLWSEFWTPLCRRRETRISWFHSVSRKLLTPTKVRYSVSVSRFVRDHTKTS